MMSSIYGVLVFLIFASFGLGFLEPSAESLFFSVVSKEQAARYYGSFFTAKTIGGFVSRLGVGLILLTFPLSVAIFLVSLVMLSLGIIAAKTS